MRTDQLVAAPAPPADPQASDGALLDAIAGGSEPAFEELRRRYRGVIEWTCRSLLRPGSEEDCSQEVFARVWQKAHLFDASRGSAAA
jgi:DNA-directed RNA polymerase specialized sigma24 family protein